MADVDVLTAARTAGIAVPVVPGCALPAPPGGALKTPIDGARPRSLLRVLPTTSAPVVLGWMYDGNAELRLSSACGNATLRRVGTYRELAEHAPGARVVVLELGQNGVPAPGTILRHLRRAGVSTSVVGWAPKIGRLSAEIVDCVRGGLDILVCGDADALAASVRESFFVAEASAVRYVLNDIAAFVTVERCHCMGNILRAGPLATARGTARRSACSVRTLQRQFATAGLPSPNTVLTWMRMLVAARLIEVDRCPIALAAATGGFVSHLAFRRVLRRRAHLAPCDLQRSGAYFALLAGFAALCSASDSCCVAEVTPCERQRRGVLAAR